MVECSSEWKSLIAVYSTAFYFQKLIMGSRASVMYFLGLSRQMDKKSLLQPAVVGSAGVTVSILVALPVPQLLICPGGITAASAAFSPSLDLGWRIHKLLALS
jgi:hypothetical protein